LRLGDPPRPPPGEEDEGEEGDKAPERLDRPKPKEEAWVPRRARRAEGAV